MTTRQLPTADAPFEIVWDSLGIAHVFASTIADAYRGMGYAEGYERLWQIHLSTLFATGTVASVLGERFVVQDALYRAFDVPAGRLGMPESDGDWIVDAYLDGLNGYIDQLEEPPPEFAHAGATPRHFTRADVASRYRFTGWFQHQSWPGKLFLGRLMATHGVDWFRHHVRRFTEADAAQVALLQEPLRRLDVTAAKLVYPDAVFSGSNNWAVTGERSVSGKAMMAMDPHQPHLIPNTWFYVHLHAPDFDTFGASFPGVPYFMMGFNQHLTWGLTTGMIDTHDVFIEEIDGDSYRTPDGSAALQHRSEQIEVRDSSPRDVTFAMTRHGPVLETLTQCLGLGDGIEGGYGTSVAWSTSRHPTSAGALARLPLAMSATEFGESLWENDVCPLVNNIICVDKGDDLRRFIAATIPKRVGVSGVVPLAGWDPAFNFEDSRASELLVERNPASGFSKTANEDTLGDDAPYPIHTFATNPARANRITEVLSAGDRFSVADFERLQLDLVDMRAREIVDDLVAILDESDEPDVRLAADLLRDWDCVATLESKAACVLYPFIDRVWWRGFMSEVLDDPILAALPGAAPTLNLFGFKEFAAIGSPWRDHWPALKSAVIGTMKSVVADVRKELGDPESWRWGRMHQITFWHTLRKHDPWRGLVIGPDAIGGSGTTLAMAMHLGRGPGRNVGDGVACRVAHGPAYRWVVDLADTMHCRFVIAGGNSGRPESDHVMDHYPLWLRGDYHDLSLVRDELKVEFQWRFETG